MKEYCSHHPTRLAHWRCPKCRQAFCPNCVIIRKRNGIGFEGEEQRLCPKCMVAARWVGAANLIDPFWNRLPKFFLYPIHLQPLVLMIILSLIGFGVVGFPVIGQVVRLVLWGVLFKYSFSALKTTAQGDLVPPKISIQTISADFHQVFKQLGIYIAIYFIFSRVAVIFGYTPALLFLVLALLFVPAMIILLVTTDSLLQALNPMLFIRLAMRIGWGYLLMYFFLFLLALAPAVVGGYVFSTLPPSLSFFLLGIAKSYYTIISYHLMGYVILQYHEAIGYEVNYETFRDPELEKENLKKEGAGDPLLGQLNVLVTEGKLDEAIELIQQHTRDTGIEDLKLSQRYYNLLKVTKRSRELMAHSAVHLDILTRCDAKAKACQLYARCISNKSDFKPTPATLLKIGGWLTEKGKDNAAMGAYNRLIKAYPDSELLPVAYFRSAQIFDGRLMKPDQARKILNHLVTKFPDHEIIPRAKSYLKKLETN